MLTYTATWMSPGETKLNEISKSQKDKYYILFF